MAEFAEVMKQARRMCGSISCDNCILPRSSDEMCIWEDAPARLTDEVIAEIEAKTLKWAAEHPESKYLTWREWSEEKFTSASVMVRPCNFMTTAEWCAISNCDCYYCDTCRDKPIPADIAEKLGIKPKEA